MNGGELAKIAQAMVVRNKGILAADESTSTIKKRFGRHSIERCEEVTLKTWGGNAANFGAGQKEMAKRARLNSLATTGGYSSSMESQAA